METYTWYKLRVMTDEETICSFTTPSYEEAREIEKVAKNLGYKVVWGE